MLVFLTLTQSQCQRGVLLKIQTDGALFIHIFYARHTSKKHAHTLTLSHAQGDIGVHMGKTCILMLRKHTNAHKRNHFSTVTHLKHG